MATVYPTGDRIKVLPLLPQDKSKGGIIIPDSAQDRPMQAVVLAVGRGKLLDNGTIVPLEMEVGDIVQFGKFAGIYVTDEDLNLDVVFMRDEEVLARAKVADLPAGLHEHDPRNTAAREARERAEAEAQAEMLAVREALLDHSFPRALDTESPIITSL